MSDNEVKNYLGVDWGEAKVGLALADEEMRMAFAFETIKNEGNLVEKIIKIIKENNIKEVVIGVPSYVNKKETIFGGEKLGELIEKKFGAHPVKSSKAGLAEREFNGVNVSYQNEMFTTKMAQTNLIEKGEKNVGKKDDAEAARIILEEWLDLAS